MCYGVPDEHDEFGWTQISHTDNFEIGSFIPFHPYIA